jgi:hypothetical protein
MIQISVAPSEAEKFIREMSVQGYEVNAEKRGSGDAYDYEFVLNGWVHDQYAVTIDNDAKTASIGIRPEE